MYKPGQRVRMVQNRSRVPEPSPGTKGTVVSCEAPYTVVFVKWDDGALPPAYLDYGDRIERIWPWGLDTVRRFFRLLRKRASPGDSGADSVDGP